MKRITLILLAGLLLCGCAAHSYESAYQKWSRASGYTLTLTRRLSVDYDEEGKENEEQTSEETLLMKKEGKTRYISILPARRPMRFITPTDMNTAS